MHYLLLLLLLSPLNGSFELYVVLFSSLLAIELHLHELLLQFKHSLPQFFRAGSS